jgi:hypothetical protein
MSEINITKVQNDWMDDIFRRILIVLQDKNYSDEEKLKAIEWLVKQGLK